METQSPSPKSPSRAAGALILALGVLSLALGCSDRTPTSPSASPAAALPSGTAIGRLDTIAIRNSEQVSARHTLSARGGTPPALLGTWGGQDIGLTVGASGATVQFDCAAGSIDAPFITDPSGHFNLPGTWWFTPPVLPNNWTPDKKPARYSGIIGGSNMMVTVTRLDNAPGQPMRFLLVHGATPRLVRCM